MNKINQNSLRYRNLSKKLKLQNPGERCMERQLKLVETFSENGKNRKKTPGGRICNGKYFSLDVKLSIGSVERFGSWGLQSGTLNTLKTLNMYRNGALMLCKILHVIIHTYYNMYVYDTIVYLFGYSNNTVQKLHY